ncbi:hypothetical protein K7X08_014031 [Anisodus acutangulus]|uniref:F-box associated beta-propeller type 3 domain-containing protein n=1 Tax=Anisodus acutangulus TaxID=402998 RepID=A0A9Q1LPW6_9SOLA|nr:hypothetical protein K7X08_014031 [Anisodus acutangulus]
MVYDSESNKWRKFVSLQDDQFTHMNKNQVVFINGGLHWLTDSCLCMLVLDLATDVWRKIELPNEISSGGVRSRVYLLELDGRLSVIQIYEAWMVIWVMEDYEREEWKMVDKVSLRCIRGMVPGIFPIMMAVDDDVNGRIGKSSSGMDELPTFHAENMQNNMKIIYHRCYTG